jgi:hypothetical protein
MANKGRLSFMKRQKEAQRKEKAAQKMARRQGKGGQPHNGGEMGFDHADDATSSPVERNDFQSV